MEPLFQLHVKDIDILLINIKERLMLDDEYSQIMHHRRRQSRIFRQSFKVQIHSDKDDPHSDDEHLGTLR